MQRRRTVAWTAVVVLGATSHALAQSGAPAGASLPTAQAPIQAGRVMVYPAIRLREIGLDTNVFNEPDVDGPKEDFTMTVNPRLQVVAPVGVLRVSGTASVDLVYFQTYSDQQSVSHLLEGRIDGTTTRLRPFVVGRRLRTRDRVGFEIDARALRVETSVVVGADFELTPLTSLTGWARQDTLAYGEGERVAEVALGEELDRTSTAAGLGVKFAVTPLTTVTLAVELQRDRFAASPLRDADSVLVAPTIDFGQGAIITGRAAVGFREFRPLNPGLPRYRGLVASVGTTFSILGTTAFDVNASRDVSYSVRATDPLYLASGGRLTVTQRVVGPFEVIGLGAWERLRYQRLGGDVLDGRVETTTAFGGGIGLRTGEYFHATLTYEVTDRISSEPGRRDYNRRRILASLDYGL